MYPNQSETKLQLFSSVIHKNRVWGSMVSLHNLLPFGPFKKLLTNRIVQASCLDEITKVPRFQFFPNITLPPLHLLSEHVRSLPSIFLFAQADQARSQAGLVSLCNVIT